MSYKKRKNDLQNILKTNDAEKAAKLLENQSSEKLINPLMGLLYDPHELIKFRAVELLGIISSDLFKKNPEKVKVMMRRFMWTLNEESGGIGWGSAEAMGEIASKIEKIYVDFYKIIISYLDPESTSFLDHKELHPGILWAIGRMGESFPETGEGAEYVLRELLRDRDPRIRGLSTWVSGICRIQGLKSQLDKLIKDHEFFEVYEDHEIKKIMISEAAQKALKAIDQS